MLNLFYVYIFIFISISISFLIEWGDLAVSFEARAYEAILKTAVTYHSISYEQCDRDVKDILSIFSVASVIPIGAQEHMREVKDKVNSILTLISSYKLLLDTVLEDEEDMALLNLSLLRGKPNLYE